MLNWGIINYIIIRICILSNPNKVDKLIIANVEDKYRLV